MYTDVFIINAILNIIVHHTLKKERNVDIENDTIGHFKMRPRISIRGSVRLSVGPSVRRSFGPSGTRFFQ